MLFKIYCKKSLKIPKWQLDSVYRRKTDNTMAKRKSTKGQTTIYKTYNKTKDRVTRTPLKSRGELWCSGRVSSSCSTSGTRRINLVTNPVISREWGKKIYHSEEKFEDVKWVIRRSKNDMQYNDLKKKLSTKGTNNDLQNITQKTKDRATLKTDINSGVPERLTLPAPLDKHFLLYTWHPSCYSCYKPLL